MITPLIILSILASPLAIAFAFSILKAQPLDVHKYARWGLACTFVFFSIGHLVKTQGMVDMLPVWLPQRLTLVYLTGLLELLVAVGLLIPQWQSRASTAAILILVTFFPANVYAAFNAVGLGGHQWGPSYLWIRTPLQAVLIGWAYFLCIKPSEGCVRAASDDSIS